MLTSRLIKICLICPLMRSRGLINRDSSRKNGAIVWACMRVQSVESICIRLDVCGLNERNETRYSYRSRRTPAHFSTSWHRLRGGGDLTFVAAYGVDETRQASHIRASSAHKVRQTSRQYGRADSVPSAFVGSEDREFGTADQ